MTDTLYVLHQGYGNDGGLWCATWDGATWTDKALGAGITGGPAVAVYNGVVHVFRQGTGDNQGVLLHTTCTNGVWSADQSLGAGLSHNPAAVVYGGKLWVFHQDGDNSGKLFHMTYDGTSWSGDTQIPLGMSYSPSATVYRGKLYLFHNGYDSRGPEHSDRSIWYSAYDGTSWGKDTLVLPSMGVGAIVGSPSVTASGNDLFLFFCRSNDGSMSLLARQSRLSRKLVQDLHSAVPHVREPGRGHVQRLGLHVPPGLQRRWLALVHPLAEQRPMGQ